MKKYLVFSALTIGSVAASVATADEPGYPPCTGNYGITYPNRCAPPPPAPAIPDEAFAPAPEVYVEVAPVSVAPAPAAPAPCVEANPTPAPAPLYQPRLGAGLLGAQASKGLFFQNPNRVREVGARSLTGDGYGASAYLRTHKANSRLGVELSLDAVDNVELTQISLVGYSKHQGVVRPYGFVGAGAYVETPGFSFQTGVGADVNLTQRITLNIDARYLTAQESVVYYDYAPDCLDCFYYDNSFDGGLVSVGFGYKFGAVSGQEKTLFKGGLFQQSAATGFSNLRAPLFAANNKYTYSTRWAQSGNLWSNPARWNQPAQGNAQRPLGLRGSASPVDSYGISKEVGVRSYTSLDYDGSSGAGVYVKAQRPQGRIAGEASLDLIDDTPLGQIALLGFLNPKGVVRPYGLLGTGLSLEDGGSTVQWGAGIDAALSNRISLSGDIRGVEGYSSSTLVTECDEFGCYDTYDYLSAVVGSLGVGIKF